MPLKTAPFDPAAYLDTPGRQQAFLDEALESGNAGEVAAALGIIARARNFAKLAREIGISRQGLTKALSREGNPSLDTFLKVTKALHLDVRMDRTGRVRRAAKG